MVTSFARLFCYSATEVGHSYPTQDGQECPSSVWANEGAGCGI